MRVELLRPDTAIASSAPVNGDVFSKVLGEVGRALESATNAEDAFAAGAGSLQDAVYERARADVAIAVTTSAAQRAAQALQAITSMQI